MRINKIARRTLLALLILIGLAASWSLPHQTAAQEPAPMPAASDAAADAAPSAAEAVPAGEATAGNEADRRFNEAMAGDSTAAPATTAPTGNPTPEMPQIDYIDLLIKGGVIGIPIGIISLIVVAVAVERTLALRRSKVIPEELIQELSDMASQGNLDPRKAYRICQQHPSAAASVIRAMLLKVGRPHSEVEHAVVEAQEREVARLWAPIRIFAFAVAVCPLLGLLGTVWGMIEAFFAMANLPTGSNKAVMLADGIYKALVTTVEGLVVAIPAAILAHIFEGRIQSLFREIDELLYSLLPQVERYEGKLRVRREHLGSEKAPGENGASKSPSLPLDDEPLATPARPAAAK